MSEVTTPDEQLVQRMAAGDETALVLLHERYARYLAAVARRMLNDPDEVEQSVQDAFVNAWEYAERYDVKKASVKTWLVTITHRLVLNRIRGNHLDTMPLQNWDAPDRQPDHVQTLYVEQAVASLEEDERELIELAFYQGFSHAQVSRTTGKPLGTVKTKLRTALGKMRDILTGGEA